MAEFPTYEEMGKEVAEKALDEFLYEQILLSGCYHRRYLRRITDVISDAISDAISLFLMPLLLLLIRLW